MGISQVVNFASTADDATSVTYDESQNMQALIDDFDANVTSQGDEGYTTPDPDDTGFQGYVTTKWMIGTFIVTIRIDQNSNNVALIPSIILPFTGQSEMANVTGLLTNVDDELVENFTLTTTNNTQLVEGKVSAYVKTMDDELQIWGHVEAQSNLLGNVNADLYFGKYTNGNYVSPTPLISVATHLIIAAFHLNDDKTIHLNNVSPDDSSLNQMWIDVARMQRSGIKVMGMLGGASDKSYSDLGNDFDDFYNVLSSCITANRLDGIDLDAENSDCSLDNIVKLIQKLRTDFGKDFIITLAPVASALKGGNSISGFDYKTLEQEYGDEIDWYNAQFYSNYGSMSDPQDYNDIITKCPLNPSRLVAGTLSNKDNGSGWVKLDTVKSTVRQLMKTYGNSFGGIAAWEYFNSKPDTAEPWTWAALMGLAMVNWQEVLALNN